MWGTSPKVEMLYRIYGVLYIIQECYIYIYIYIVIITYIYVPVS